MVLDSGSFGRPHDWPWEATERWVRFYSHPDGGQNPTTPAEYEEVVTRVTTIIDEAWGDDDEVMLVTGNVPEPGQSPVQSESQVAVQRGAVPWQEVLDSNGIGSEDEDVWSWRLWVSWYSRGNLLLDKLIRKVEDKEVEFVTLVMPNARIALHPYDGGIDVLLRRVSNVTDGVNGTQGGHHRAPTGCSTELPISPSRWTSDTGSGNRARQAVRRVATLWHAGTVALYGASSLAFKRGVRVRC